MFPAPSFSLPKTQTQILSSFNRKSTEIEDILLKNINLDSS